jgi:hypothetical protein
LWEDKKTSLLEKPLQKHGFFGKNFFKYLLVLKMAKFLVYFGLKWAIA